MASTATGAETRGWCDSPAFTSDVGGRAPCSVWPWAECAGAGCETVGASASHRARRTFVDGRAVLALCCGASRAGLVAPGAGRSTSALANGSAYEQQTPVCDAPGSCQVRVVTGRVALAARKSAAKRCTAAAHSQTAWPPAGTAITAVGADGAAVRFAGQLGQSGASCAIGGSGPSGVGCGFLARKA